jgi:hypothetical protein
MHGAGDGGISVLFSALAHPLRRYVLYCLSGRDEPVSLDELAADVTNAGYDEPDESATELVTALHHTHLPNLDEAGVITYSPAQGTIALEEVPHLDRVLQLAATFDLPDHEFVDDSKSLDP